jgi:hypothetical protein
MRSISNTAVAKNAGDNTNDNDLNCNGGTSGSETKNVFLPWLDDDDGCLFPFGGTDFNMRAGGAAMDRELEFGATGCLRSQPTPSA